MLQSSYIYLPSFGSSSIVSSFGAQPGIERVNRAYLASHTDIITIDKHAHGPGGQADQQIILVWHTKPTTAAPRDSDAQTGSDGAHRAGYLGDGWRLPSAVGLYDDRVARGLLHDVAAIDHLWCVRNARRISAHTAHWHRVAALLSVRVPVAASGPAWELAEPAQLEDRLGPGEGAPEDARACCERDQDYKEDSD